MELFCEFSIHDYMDMYPSKQVKPVFGENKEAIEANARNWAREMTSYYFGGPTTFVKVMSKEEAEVYVKKVIATEDADPKSDSEFYKQAVLRVFNKCYQ